MSDNNPVTIALYPGFDRSSSILQMIFGIKYGSVSGNLGSGPGRGGREVGPR